MSQVLEEGVEVLPWEVDQTRSRINQSRLFNLPHLNLLLSNSQLLQFNCQEVFRNNRSIWETIINHVFLIIPADYEFWKRWIFFFVDTREIKRKLLVVDLPLLKEVLNQTVLFNLFGFCRESKATYPICFEFVQFSWVDDGDERLFLDGEVFAKSHDVLGEVALRRSLSVLYYFLDVGINFAVRVLRVTHVFHKVWTVNAIDAW